MQLLLVVASLAALATSATAQSNLIQCNCTSIKLPNNTITKLQDILKNISTSNTNVNSNISQIITNITVTIEQSTTETNVSVEVLPQIIDLVVTLLNQTDPSTLPATVQTLQDLLPVLNASQGEGGVSKELLDLLSLIINLLLSILDSQLGGDVKSVNGTLTVDGKPVDQATLDKLLDDDLLKQITDIIVQLLNDILNKSTDDTVKSLLADITPLLQSLQGSAGGGLDNVLETVVALLSNLLAGGPVTSESICTKPMLTNNSLSFPIVQTIQLDDLSDTLNKLLAGLANDPATLAINVIKQIQDLLKTATAGTNPTPDQVLQLLTLINSLNSLQGQITNPALNKTIISLTSSVLPSSCSASCAAPNPTPNPTPNPSISITVNLLPAIQQDLQPLLANLTALSGSAPNDVKQIIAELTTAISGLTDDPSALVNLIKVLISAYKLLGEDLSDPMNDAANALIDKILNILSTLTPTTGGISKALALIANFIDTLHDAGTLNTDQVVSTLSSLIDSNGQITVPTLLNVLIKILGLIPNLPDGVKTALTKVTSELQKFANGAGSTDALEAALTALQTAINGVTGSQSASLKGLFNWLITVLLSIFSNNSELTDMLTPFLDTTTPTPSGGDCSNVLLGSILCPVTDLLLGNGGIVPGLTKVLEDLLKGLGLG